MATKLILALIFSLIFTSQVSSDPNNNEEISQTLFNRGGDRKLMHNFVVDISKNLKGRLISGGLALAPAAAPSSIDCDELCKNRCSLHSRQNTCLRACGTCCVRCKCVPPGTFGNRELCGKCYTDMTTHANKTKCP